MSNMFKKLCSREIEKTSLEDSDVQISQLATRSSAFRRGAFFAWVFSYCSFFFFFLFRSHSFLTSDSSSVSPSLLSLINWLAGWLAGQLASQLAGCLVPGSSVCSVFSPFFQLSLFPPSYSIYLFSSCSHINI